MDKDHASIAFQRFFLLLLFSWYFLPLNSSKIGLIVLKIPLTVPNIILKTEDNSLISTHTTLR